MNNTMSGVVFAAAAALVVEPPSKSCACETNPDRKGAWEAQMLPATSSETLGAIMNDHEMTDFYVASHG